ncbi:hypothetical protein GGI04_000232 [Coemansia thaxteri]|nr:hypothetical protein GGI04_000232 [Coemansia thaxteri]
MRTTGDIEDDDDDEDEDDDGNDNEDEDDEGEEDADFEAPMVSAPHPRSPDLAATDVDMEVSRRLQQPGHSAGDDESTRINNRPMGEVATETTAESPESAAPPVDDVERLLLPLAMLPEHIPAQCPPFPSPHTYKQTPVYPEREQDFFRNRMQKAEQSRQAEENLQRLINGSRRGHGMPPASTDTAEPVGEGTQKAKQTARERLEELFPPANFRNTCKRTRLTGYIQ